MAELTPAEQNLLNFLDKLATSPYSTQLMEEGNRVLDEAVEENQELSVLSLHLLQICLVYINTLMIQRVLQEKHWSGKLTPEDQRALTPLIYSHVTPYGTFRLDMNERLSLLSEPELVMG